MIHRIDGRVAFVGVLDILPGSMASVYLFYDPKWTFLSPGTLGALREIEYMKKMKKLQLAPQSLTWYCMGKYFYDC